MTVIFQLGMLAGREFEVKYYHDPVKGKAARRFEIVPAETAAKRAAYVLETGTGGGGVRENATRPVETAAAPTDSAVTF